MTTGTGAKRSVTELRKIFERNSSGRRSTFVKPEQKFYLHLKMTNPADPGNDAGKLINFPEGVRVRLMNNGKLLRNKGSVSETDANGKVCLAPDSLTIKSSPSYHFRIDLDERIYYDIDQKKLVKSADIKEDDERNLMEIPMVVDIKNGGFHYDESKLTLTNGMLENYDKNKKGEGTEADPIVLEVRFYWYYLQFKYFDRIQNKILDVPRGMPIVPKIDTQEYLDRYVKKVSDFGYNTDTEAKKIQHHLNLLGFNCGKVDGIIGPKTKAGIKKFQKAYKLKVDGIAGPITKRTLEQIFYRRKAGVWKDKNYSIPVWKMKDGFNKVYFEMAKPGYQLATRQDMSRFDLFLYTKDKDTDPILVTREKAKEKDTDADCTNYEKLTFLRSRYYYDLPVEWSSRNYWTRYNNDMDKGERFDEVMKNKVKLYPFETDETKRANKTKPLMFSLDDIVLVKDNADRSQDVKDKKPNNDPLDLDDKSRYTIFYIDHTTKETDVHGTEKNVRRIKIYKPEAKQPVFTNFKFKKNLICDVPGHTRIVYFCNDFYDVYNKRSSKKKPDGSDYTFDDSKHVLGARLAVKNDPDMHKKKYVNAQTDADDVTKGYGLKNPGQYGCGHYEMHYFHNCTELDNKMLAYLFIYWSCRLTIDSTSTTKGTAADVKNHREEGMTNAMERLNKDYMIEMSADNDINKRNDNKVDIFIRPYHFMEAKSDTNGGKHMTETKIMDDTITSYMTSTLAELEASSYHNQPNLLNDAANNNLADTNGKTYIILTNHHEMGHTTGNWDDYMYDYSDGAGNTWSDLYTYDQPFTAVGGPYNCDILARMKTNRSPRLRNFWKYVCWLHDEGKPAVPARPPRAEQPAGLLYDFHKGTRFKITLKGKKNTDNFTHNFELKSKYKNVAKAAENEDNHTITVNAHADLLLYKLGDDELSHFANLGKLTDGYQTTQVFKGILVVKTKFSINFVDAPPETWDFNNSLQWARGLNSEMTNMLNGKFRIHCPDAANDFSNIYVFFVPHFQVHTAGDPAESHFNVEVKWQMGNDFDTTGKKIKVDWDTNKKKIIRYCFGKTTGVADLTNTEFPTIVNWIKAKANNTNFAMANL